MYCSALLRSQGWRSVSCVALAGLAVCGQVPSAAAIDVLYTFEGDAGATATDKLPADGSHDGVIFQQVDPADTTAPIYGAQSAFFDLPNPGVAVPPYSTLEIPETTFGPDFSLTLAAHFRNDEVPPNFTRLFSSYRGSGAVSAQRLLVDYDPRGTGAVTGLRAIVNNVPLVTPAVPEGMGDSGYHHFALTIDAGAIRGYFNGVEVLSGDVGLGYSNEFNLFLGEDPHDGGGSANEQFIGNLDEFLLIERALSASDIAQLAAGATVSSVVTPLANERAVYYDFEGLEIVDRFTLDGAQNPVATAETTLIAGAGEALLGDGAVNLQDPRINNPPSPFSQISVGPVGSLGAEFTLSAAINMLGGGQNGGGLARLFSTYPGVGSTVGRLILDVNPNVEPGGIGTRLILPDGTVLTADVAPLAFQNETVTAVYDRGAVKLYLSGVEIAAGTAKLGGEIDLGGFELRIGEDTGGNVNENFVGLMDDVLVLRQALTAEQVAALHASGAEALIATLPPRLADADFNADGSVDAADFAAWGSHFGLLESATRAEGDATADGRVTGADLLRWQRSFGGAASAAAAVPEPALGGWGAVLAVATALGRPRGGRRPQGTLRSA